jgi:FKBP-type peptidyl-prolyl cis-trans isomerase (trigger factor)
MELEKTLSRMGFPLCYKNVIDEINLEKSNDFVKAMLNTIINKYGSQTVRNEIERDNSNSPISNHLSHIIEVGGLKVISDNKLNINDNEEFQDIIVSVVIVLNCSIAIELKNLNLYNGNTSNYYGNDAILTLAKRLAKHTNDGMNYTNGFEHYSSIMIIENLLNKITN